MTSVNRNTVLELAFVAMEALILFLVDAVVAGGANHSPLPYPCFLATALGGFYLVRALLRVDLPRGVLVTTGAIATMVALVLIAGLGFEPRGLPPAGFGRAGAPGFAALVAVGLLVGQWARGAQVAQQRISRARALGSFSVGMAVLLAALVLGQDTPARAAENGAAIPLVACGLLTLALIHLRDARERGGEALRGPWLSITLGSIAGLVVAGAALGVAPLAPLGWLYDHTVAPALLLLLTGLIWASLIVAYPFAWIIAQIIAKLMGGPPAKPPVPDTSQSNALNKALQNQDGNLLAPIVILALKLLFVLVLVAVAAYLAYRLFGHLNTPDEEDGEERESIAAEGSLRTDLEALLASLRPRRAAHDEPPEPDLPAGALAVRRLYLRVLDQAAHRGATRPPAATPDEFSPALEAAFASTAPRSVSSAFMAARYGRIAPSAGELRRLEHDVDGLEQRPGAPLPRPLP